jgi:hypothetical protein
MINAYSDILSYSGDEWEDFLTKICLIDIFKDLIPLFKDKEALTQAIRYIVMCYSKDSDCVILGTDWVSNKKRIFDKVLIHKDYYQDLVLLENGIVIKAIQRWLSFQDSAVYSQLIMLKDLQQEMQDSANSSIKKANLEIDYDQKFKNAKYVNELKIMIDDLEQELIQNNPKLKEATKELSKAKAKNTLGLEAFVN